MTMTLPNPAETEPAPRPFHWTVEAFYRAAEAGVFPEGRHIEIIRGELIEKIPPSPTYANQSDNMAHLLRRVLEPRAFACGKKSPFTLTLMGSQFPPSLSFNPLLMETVTLTRKTWCLLIEVAISSAQFDTGEKALLYAQAGIADYWVALAETQTLLVHREPSDAGYQAVTTLTETASISPLALPEASFGVRDLFGEAEERVQPS